LLQFELVMELKNQINADLKKAMLNKESEVVSVLRGIKSVILEEEIKQGARDEGLNDAAILKLLQKESKKRSDSADIYKTAGDEGRAQAELSEKAIIDSYLPAQVSDEELTRAVEEAVKETGATTMRDMGAVIKLVQQKTSNGADNSRIAQAVKGVLS
jgi:uncharacterized protein